MVKENDPYLILTGDVGLGLSLYALHLDHDLIYHAMMI